MQKKVALFSVSSLGLGHATRTIPIIRAFLSTHDIHIISFGNALEFLKKEFTETSIKFHSCTDYPPLERGKGWQFYWYIVIDSLYTTYLIRKEHNFVCSLVKDIKPEFIISDGRYGSYMPDVPSFIISHQISFIMPKGLGFFQKIADFFNYKTFKKFNTVIIPDYEDIKESLAGQLSHNVILERLNHEYVGILSSLKTEPVQKDIDFLFTISGYLMEHKPSFITFLLEEAKKLSGKKVFVLGNTEENCHDFLPEHDIEIYSSVSGDVRQQIFNRAKNIISRSGYTTIMDLAELGIKGFLIPTPGQTEQEYLAEYLGQKKWISVIVPWRTEVSVNKILNIILKTIHV
jgi:uncharacterized protein (TIGR00661 family)